MDTETKKIASKIIRDLGGATQVSRLFAQNYGVRINRSTIQKWSANGVPARWVPMVSKLSGIPVQEIRPEIYRNCFE